MPKNNGNTEADDPPNGTDTNHNSHARRVSGRSGGFHTPVGGANYGETWEPIGAAERADKNAQSLRDAVDVLVELKEPAKYFMREVGKLAREVGGLIHENRPKGLPPSDSRRLGTPDDTGDK